MLLLLLIVVLLEAAFVVLQLLLFPEAAAVVVSSKIKIMSFCYYARYSRARGAKKNSRASGCATLRLSNFFYARIYGMRMR
jgi:hypothetical protein